MDWIKTLFPDCQWFPENKTWTSGTNAVQERTMTLYIKYHHMNSRNSEIRIKSLKVCICLQFVTLLYFPAACLSALVSHTLSTGRSGWICPPVQPYIFWGLLTILSENGHFRPFSKVGLGKMGRGEIPNPHLSGYPPQSFLICYTAEYQ